MTSPDHIPVLPAQTLTLLDPQPNETAADLTLGSGGHAALIAERIGPGGTLIGFDLDPGSIEAATERLRDAHCRIITRRDSFVAAPRELESLGLNADIVLADLGFSSSQMDDPARGFSFRADGPLDMRLDPDQSTTARELVNTLEEAELARIIFRYGEEPLARKIARNLAQSRADKPIHTTAELARLVLEAYGSRARSSRMHPATRTFMALRIAVNHELEALDALLDAIRRGAETAGESGWLNRGARVAVISFHSLEDRQVKRAFAELERRSLAKRLTKKPLTAAPDEVERNPRARSAKLRAVRIDGPGEMEHAAAQRSNPAAITHGR